jgi:hypothetical protein
MSQLFVFLSFMAVLIVSSFIPSDSGEDFSTGSKIHVCEKQIYEGIKIISRTKNKYLPCWFQDERE